MSERHMDDEVQVAHRGPVITISREAGCPAKKISAKLVQIMNEKRLVKNKKSIWKWVSKEILSESAKELETDPEKIQYVFDYEQKSLIEELLASHSHKYYKSDRKIRNTIGKVIRSIANEGHVIIVGRGGVAITKDIEKSLHINLHAPLEWRAIRYSEKHCNNLDDARELAKEVDRKREQFRNYFHGKNTDYTEFDVTINCMTFTIDEIARAIANIIEIRGFI